MLSILPFFISSFLFSFVWSISYVLWLDYRIKNNRSVPTPITKKEYLVNLFIAGPIIWVGLTSEFIIVFVKNKLRNYNG